MVVPSLSGFVVHHWPNLYNQKIILWVSPCHFCDRLAISCWFLWTWCVKSSIRPAMTCFLLLAVVAASEPVPVVKSYVGTFRGCYDGDTCTFDLILSDSVADIGAGLTQRTIITKMAAKVRLCDINAPEIKPGPNPAAIKARDDLVKWISAAKAVTVEVPQKPNCVGQPCDKVEKYGRLLGYIVADGVNLNERQITKGNAVPFMGCK